MNVLMTVLLVATMFVTSSSNAQSEPDSDPWTLLGRLRDHLSSKPAELDFVQSFIPNGFSSGDQESGTMALILPDCIRWDYEEPFPKIFLLCDQTAYAWNPGETTGRRYQVAAEDLVTLELLRLSTENLRDSYSASSNRLSGDAVAIELVPTRSGSQIASAMLLVPASHDRLLALEYKDSDGNLTRFEFSTHRPLVAGEHFAAPSGIAWLDG